MEKFSGMNFCFLGFGVGRVYSGAILPMFSALLWGLSFPKLSRENSLLVRSVVWQNFRERTFVFVTCNRAVTHSWLLVRVFPPFRRGKCCPLFSFCVFVSGSASFVVFLPVFFSEGRCLKEFSGANFCFWVSVLVSCVLVLFCLCFCFSFGCFVPETVLKNSLDVRSGVFGLSSFFLWLFRRRRRSF